MRLVFGALLLAGPAWGVQAAEYPVKPIVLVVAGPPGGGTDAIARILSAELSQSLGQSVVVSNRAGASGAIGSTAVAQLDPDLACTTEDFIQAYYPQDTSIALVQAHVSQHEATVTVEFGNYNEPFFDPFIGQERFELSATEAGQWHITEAPWPVYDCAGTL